MHTPLLYSDRMSAERLHLLSQSPTNHPTRYSDLNNVLGLGWDMEVDSGLYSLPQTPAELVVGIVSESTPLLKHHAYPIEGNETIRSISLPPEKATRLRAYFAAWFARTGGKDIFENNPSMKDVYRCDINCFGFAGYVAGWSRAALAPTPSDRDFVLSRANPSELAAGSAYILHENSYRPHAVIGIGKGNTSISVFGMDGPLVIAPTPWTLRQYLVDCVSHIRPRRNERILA